MDAILNSFKVNLSLIQEIREIELVASGQVRSKIRKSTLKEKLKFSKILAASQEGKNTESTTSDSSTDKNLAKKTLVELETTLKKSSLDLNSFLAGTQEDLYNIIW